MKDTTRTKTQECTRRPCEQQSTQPQRNVSNFLKRSTRYKLGSKKTVATLGHSSYYSSSSISNDFIGCTVVYAEIFDNIGEHNLKGESNVSLISNQKINQYFSLGYFFNLIYNIQVFSVNNKHIIKLMTIENKSKKRVKGFKTYLSLTFLPIK